MKVELLAYTPNPEAVVASAARLCWTDCGATELKEKLSREEIEQLIRKLAKAGHWSPFEHASFTFAIEGISRACSHQLVRHRIASYSQKSQRYVDESNFKVIIPPSIRKNSEALQLFDVSIALIKTYYCDLCDLIPKEDARYILPNAIETNLVCTFNARSLLNLFRLRCCQRAQWEIRELANEMLKLCREVAPVLFEKAGAPCETGEGCKEENPCRKENLKW